MKGKEIVYLQLSPEEAEGLVEEIRRLAESKSVDLPYDFPYLFDLRELILTILGK